MGRSMGALGALAALALFSREGHAQQADLNPPLPDVLLLVDNSGSMERMIDGTLPEDNANGNTSACDVTCNGAACSFGPTVPQVANRWNTLLEALAGTPTNGFHCVSMPRSPNSTFTDEYQINGTFPYDTGYYLNFHRMVAKDTSTSPATACVWAPGSLPGAAVNAGVGIGKFGAGGTTSADSFPSSPPPLVTRAYGATMTSSNNCAFAVNTDGALVQYQNLMRFALMTFDSDPDASTGVSPSYSYSVLPGPFTGMWSYYPGWGGLDTGVSASGNPIGCAKSSPYEVGARNPAAPPWEGRMVPFPPANQPEDTDIARQAQNQVIRQVLSSTRPYGATPLAGMFADAMYYFWTDPAGPSGKSTAVNGNTYSTRDKYVLAHPPHGCRQQYIILLTDGAPNQDLRESCGSLDNPAAPCPYNHPEWTAATLQAGNGGPSVTTFVIGFAVSSGQDQSMVTRQCSTLQPGDCVNPTPSLQACCELEKIAVAGAPPPAPGQPSPHAYFADTPGDLQAALGAILAQIAQTQTTRTIPSYSPVAANISNASTNPAASNQSTLYSSFNPARPVPAGSALTSTGAPWTGNIQRSRLVCSLNPTTPQPLNPGLGDDFRTDLAQSTARNFIAFQPKVVNGVLNSSGTMRPFATSTNADGLGMFSSSLVGAQVAGAASDIVTAMLTPSINPLGLTTTCPYASDQFRGTQPLSISACTTMLLDFTMGQPFSGPSDFPFVSRVGMNAFGGIFHATPVVVGPPSSLVRDDAYDQFRTSTLTTKAKMGTPQVPQRDTIAYAATTDGLLHAFWTDVPTVEQNEEWAFMPPGVMPQLKASYPATDQFVLDGTPIVRDVVWDRQAGSMMNAAGNNPWHTTLVASFGPLQQGYYALDVSNPFFTSGQVPTNTTPTDPPGTSGPVFLWQFTTMPPQNLPLFGRHSATPAIAQVAIGNPVREVGVAILPGGWDQAAKTGGSGCARDTVTRHLTDWSVPTTDSIPYKFRQNVRCWGGNGVNTDYVIGRSVTIVRLDTGEIIATFARKYDAQHYFLNDSLLNANPIRLIDTPLDSPMTGIPSVFPDQVGVDAKKFYLSDQDGTIWRFDISSADPTQWTGKLYFDLYNTTADTSPTSWNDGEPVVLPMLTSLDRFGRVVLHAASGNQDTFDLSGPNYLASLYERVATVGGTPDFHAGVNWYMGSQYTIGGVPTSDVMLPGERVSGPMVVFDSKLYFTTYVANSSSTDVCSAGDSRLWKADFVAPAGSTGTGTVPSQGGVPYPIPPATSTTPAWLDLVTNGITTAGVVVPGVAVTQTTACAQVATGTDSYFPGVTQSTLTNYTAGAFSLEMQLGKSNLTGGVQTKNISIAPPASPTIIDSWAAVTE